MKTLISHFYNEEYLLPAWLRHHRRIFDHGILIDYNSTDSSRDIIRDLCPNWEIYTTENTHFDSWLVDVEVMRYEAEVSGWRMTLNTTEFLYGNHQQLDDLAMNTQCLVGNWIFVGDCDINNEQPLHLQYTQGYYQGSEGCGSLSQGDRCLRSIHNYALTYQAGRHWGSDVASYDDLAIFYYGYANTTEQMLNRKLQIKSKMTTVEIANGSHPNTVNRKEYLKNIQRHRSRSIDITAVVARLAEYNYGVATKIS